MNFMKFFKKNNIVISTGLAVFCSASAYSMDMLQAAWQTPLHVAARNGNQRIVNFLIRLRANLNLRNKDGYTPLHLAARYDHQPIVETLIRSGAYINLRNNHGWTPLHLAAKNNHQAVVETLIRAGADPTLKDYNGYSPLHVAARYGHREVVELIKRLVQQHALAFTSGLHERLGSESPLQLLNGFEHITRFIVAHGGLSTKDELKEELPELL